AAADRHRYPPRLARSHRRLAGVFAVRRITPDRGGCDLLGTRWYLEKVAPQIWSVLDWFLRLSAYMLLLVDRFPTDEARGVVTAIRYTGHPTAGSALARLIT